MRHLLRLKSVSFFSLGSIALASLNLFPIATPTFAGDVRENRFASAPEESATPTSPNANGVNGVEGTPSDDEIAVVEKGLDLARALIPEERFGQERAFENRDVAKIERLSRSLNRITQCCDLIAKYGVQNFLPRLSFENQVFIAEEGIALKLQPYLSRTASRAQKHSDKIAAEVESQRQRAESTWSTRLTRELREPSTNYQPEKLASELKSIESELKANQRSGKQQRQELLDRVEEINQINKRKVDGINRKPWQPGYTLSERRAAAKALLMRRGYTSEDAALTVQSMESIGLLPDPPKQ
ncbi:hypothetical protein [Novipirellula aureliae]|uniref:hypothetical protein n=1 Tax=Novipirellula aureliae TaxID=2527966 RepID=UPI0011B42F8A|nr:hypothetical protein [Novipirellula aureliae]